MLEETRVEDGDVSELSNRDRPQSQPAIIAAEKGLLCEISIAIDQVEARADGGVYPNFTLAVIDNVKALKSSFCSIWDDEDEDFMWN